MAKKNPIFQFNQAIIDSTSSFVCSFKPQAAYYGAIGAEKELEMTIQYIHEEYSDIPVILDAKEAISDPPQKCMQWRPLIHIRQMLLL